MVLQWRILKCCVGGCCGVAVENLKCCVGACCGVVVENFEMLCWCMLWCCRDRG